MLFFSLTACGFWIFGELCLRILLLRFISLTCSRRRTRQNILFPIWNCVFAHSTTLATLYLVLYVKNMVNEQTLKELTNNAKEGALGGLGIKKSGWGERGEDCWEGS